MDFWIKSVDHIGIAVPNIEDAQRIYAILGYKARSEKQPEPDYGVNTLMMDLGSHTIELLEPLVNGEESPIDRYIKTKPYTMYHIAYRVSNFAEAINDLQNKKFVMIGQPRVSSSAGGKNAVFMFNRNMGIIELLED